MRYRIDLNLRQFTADIDRPDIDIDVIDLEGTIRDGRVSVSTGTVLGRKMSGRCPA